MKKIALAAAVAALVLSGCANDGRYYRSDTYAATSVNQAQQVRTVEILSIGNAQVAVSNTDNRSDAKTIGTILGAIAGAAIGSHNNHDTASRVLGGLAGGAVGNIAGGAVGGDRTSYVDGVQLTFRYNNKLYNSAQVGRVCEFKPGLAVMISTTPTETRIQPNNPGGCGQ
ncbi:MAG TPA: glycine zipper 2TM domain-containing protein [Candidatus Aphodousia faecalis]|nr:glycine zipper 2TM domain-containing protein [Candidatus Aphodousia faecalis]